MAVYTHLTRDDIAAFLSGYDVGSLADFTGITEGVSNTNYLIETSKGKYILTLFERRFRLEDLPYFTALMEWWSTRGIDCPSPIRMKDGRVLSALKERPALVVSFLEGDGVKKITLDHLHALGALAAKMHITGMDFPHKRDNALSLKGWENLVDAVYERADEIVPGLGKIISDEYNYLNENWPQELPGGPIHADLFPDNVFFTKLFGKKSVLSGVIDFYFACNDAWAYDLAICVNAWCFDERHRLVPERVQTLMQSYNEERSMTMEEDAAFPLLLRGAALRFLLTRTQDWLNPAKGADITLKDPLEYLAKLQYFQSNAL
jgi:homoserine kinase type II